ncbi:MAG: 7-carboxy-7-deazaguanine synthase QueE [Gammaproteobacteria bacterium]|nr:7-carboxy-7-deazaguanine synthase QueE [Gammaproteobacteria bacterium]MCI0590792.1 7-carboxy-7-deazaguanine synthase QueE [Gammaproteobacteria bacterium]
MGTSSVQASRQASLRITEIFYSIQGESQKIGLPTAFIRLTGCPLRCQYCDTAYAFHGGEDMSMDSILQRIAGFNAQHVTVTGGEPLAQKDCLILLRELCDSGYHVSLETSGALDLSGVDKRVMKVVDFKTPGSGEEAKNRYSSIEYLSSQDQIKFVLCDRNDYEWAKSKINEFALHQCCEVLFSPSHEELDAATLADWILQDHLPVRFQIQLHKYLWGNVPGK